MRPDRLDDEFPENPAGDRAGERVDFNISNKGISVGATVSHDYFEARVLPLITALLADMTPPPKRRPSPKRASKPAPKDRSLGAMMLTASLELPAVAAAPATRARAIHCYAPKPATAPNETQILA